jgi:hypothetical protein
MMSHELAAQLLSRPNMPVYTASDEEGNSFNHAEDFSIELVERGSEESYEITLFNREELLSEGDYEEDEIDKAFQDALIIWP